MNTKKSIYTSIVLVVFVISYFVLWPSDRVLDDPVSAPAVALSESTQEIASLKKDESTALQEAASSLPALAKETVLKDFDLWLSRKPLGDDVEQWQQEGLLLAKTRQNVMAELIRRAPESALSQSISFENYANLPDAVKPYVERPFSEQVDLVVLPDEGGVGVDSAMLVDAGISNRGAENYIEFVNTDDRRAFTVYRYGARENIFSKNNISAQGITLGGEAVIASTALTLVSEEERAYVNQLFPSKASSAKTDFYTGESIQGEAVLALAGGQVFHFSSAKNVKKLNAKLATLEAQNNPKVGSQVLFQIMGAEFDPTKEAGFSGFLDDYISGTQVAADWTTTPKDVFFIRVQTSDNVNAVISQADLQTALDSSSDLIRLMSQNKTYLNPAVSSQLITLSNTAAYYGGESSSVIYNEAKQLFDALGTGVDLTTYDIVGVYIGGTRLPVSWAGLASVGGAKHWLNNSTSLRVITHEFGHNYGLSHSNFWETNNLSVVGAGTDISYGDKFDIMGGASAPEGYFNGQSQVFLNWLDAASWTDVTSSGTYRTYRFDHENAAGNRALRISRNGDGHYWLGHRQNFDSNAWLESGLYVLWQFEGVANRSSLIDTTPGSFADDDADKNDAGVVLGQTYSDTSANIHITALAKGGTAPNEWIDVQVNLGAFPSNSAPSVSLVVPDTLIAREPLTFTANATDPDGDALAYQWDFGDGVIHNSRASVDQTWLAGGSYTVKVTVSDMKGQTVSSQVNVVVSDPLTAWVDRTSNTSENLRDIASNGSALLAVGRPVLTSTDGQTWTQLKDQLGWNIRLYGVIHDGSQWVAVGSDYDFGISSWVGAIYTSADGSTWTEQHNGGAELDKIAFGASTYVAVGDGGTILSSSDAINWTPRSSGVTTTLRDVAFSNGTFVVVGGHWSGNENVVLTSTNGTVWSNVSNGAGVADWQSLRHISQLNNQFVASGWYSKIRYSIDSGQTFQTTRTSTEITPALAFGNQVYFAAGTDPSPSPDVDVDLVSVDGKSWVRLATPSLDDRNAAIFFNNTFITVGNNGSIRQSGLIVAPGTGETDTDGDGATAENSVPDLSGAGRGDGDGDGTADGTQNNVTSFLATDATNWLTYRNNSGGAQSNLLTSAAPSSVPTDQYLVYGVAQYDVATAAGANVTIEVYVTQNTAIQDYLLLSNGGQWKPQNATVTHTGNKTKLVFTVTEGGEFDRDASANGVLQLAQGGVMVRTGFEISPYAHSFGITALNTPTANQSFSVTNKGSRSLTFAATALTGAYSNQFNVASDNCSGQSVAAGASCTVEVNMQPTSVGSKSAWLEISTDDPDNATAVAFLNNYESTEQQARRRLPPVLYSLTGLPEVMTIGQSYTVTWEVLGYHDNYFSTIVFFDCTGVAASTCGSNYGDNFESSGVLSATSVAVGDWTYNGVVSKRFTFSYTFTPTSVQFPNPADIVVRFYRKNTDDSAAGKNSLSLIIPGNLSDTYYDTSGRRIQKRVEQ